ncbi:MAG: hypothetical protein ACREI3_04125 [Nitrospirales bacterium]
MTSLTLLTRPPLFTWLTFPAVVFGVLTVTTGEADGPPCDRYSKKEQARCEDIWKDLNAEDETKIVRFGVEQLERRKKGLITPEQHLAENFAFIQESTTKRLKQLAERMRQP